MSRFCTVERLLSAQITPARVRGRNADRRRSARRRIAECSPSAKRGGDRPDETELPADECHPRPASTAACADSSLAHPPRAAPLARSLAARGPRSIRMARERCMPGLSKTYARMDTAALPPIRLTEFSHGGGCGCKIAPGVLRELLAKSSPGLVPSDLLVGIETSDDAAVYRLNDRQAIVATTDFFMPIVDDPFAFGAIAATNALSDIYAMGATPLFALALVAMPLERLPLATIRA